MSQDRSPAAVSPSQDLLTRLLAVEEAMQALERQVRAVDRQPRQVFQPALATAAGGPPQQDERRRPALVIEVAA